MPPVTRLALNFEKEMVNNGMPLTVKEARLSLKEVLTTPKTKLHGRKESSKE